MTEHDILTKCNDAFPGMSSKPDLSYTLEDLEQSTLNNRNNLLKQTQLAKDLGFPSTESIVDRASVAKACLDHVQASKDSTNQSELLDQYRRKLADATLHGSSEVNVLRLGQGTLSSSQRLFSFQAPELSDSQKNIMKAITGSPDLDAKVKQVTPNDFWITVKRK